MSFMTKQDQVAEILRERIVAGTYRRGERLKQSEIASELGVSVTPVREALHVLEAEGYIVGMPHRGLLVPEIDIGQADQLLRLRVLLERDLTILAAGAMTPRDIGELRRMHEVLAAAIARGDLFAVRAANYRFHFRLYEYGGSPQATSFVRILWAKYPFVLQEAGIGRLRAMLGEHEHLLSLLESGDSVGAGDALADHINAGWRQLLAVTPEMAKRDA